MDEGSRGFVDLFELSLHSLCERTRTVQLGHGRVVSGPPTGLPTGGPRR